MYAYKPRLRRENTSARCPCRNPVRHTAPRVGSGTSLALRALPDVGECKPRYRREYRCACRRDLRVTNDHVCLETWSTKRESKPSPSEEQTPMIRPCVDMYFAWKYAITSVTVSAETPERSWVQKGLRFKKDKLTCTATRSECY